METGAPLGSIIGFDAASVNAAGGVNRGRRSTDVDGSTFAEVYDLATYASSGSRKAALVETPRPLQALPAIAGGPLPMASGAAPTPAAVSGLDGIDRAAADRLYLHLTSGGSWLRVSDDRSGNVVMRLHDAGGAPVRELSITELQGDGPEVA